MQLLDLVINKYKIISVVGMAKNAGKTVVLNELILEAMYENIPIGLTSIGRDGEKQDVVTFTEKPLIYVQEGTLIATAKETFEVSEARLEILEITDFRTSLGQVIIARALTSGHVQIAGPSTNGDIKSVSEKMISYGAHIVIVDGAIDRKSSASPAITEATILSTGAVISRDMNKVIEESAHQVSLFTIDMLQDEEVRLIAQEAFEDSSISIINEEYEAENLEVRTALNSGREIARALKEDSRYVLLRGSLVTKTLKDIIDGTKLYTNVTFVVQDPTKVFIGYKEWKYFMKAGIKVAVIDNINVLAVTVNPYSPLGYYFSPKDFVDKMGDALNPVPVLDIMQDGGYLNVHDGGYQEKS